MKKPKFVETFAPVPCHTDCALDFLEGCECCMAHNRTEPEAIRSLAVAFTKSAKTEELTSLARNP